MTNMRAKQAEHAAEMFLKKKALMEDALEGEEFFDAQEYTSSAASKEVNDIIKSADPEPAKKTAANVAA